jgi:bacillithiol synthase
VPSLVDRYLAGGARATFEGHFQDVGDRRRAVERAARPLAPEVADALAAQNDSYGHCPARAAHLEALRRGCAAVVTGQQVGLFLGPLYTVYKAASAIAVARALSRETGQSVVPVFWLQTEDHDLPEVASCHILCAGSTPRALALPAQDASRAARVALAHIALPGEIEACLHTLQAELGGLPEARSHLERLARHYRPGVGIARAFAGLLAELFAEEGLVLCDPRCAPLAAVAASVHRRALQEASPIARALSERIAQLEHEGFEAPVHVRQDAPLSFFHPQDATGPRYRLAKVADRASVYSEVGGAGQHTLQELLSALQSDPLRFSTSALLRPILQDQLLPTAAYVGGPGELAYFAQLPPLYAAFGMQMPLIVPRARFAVIEAKAQRLLARLGCSAAQVAAPTEALLAAISAQETSVPTGAALEQALTQRAEGLMSEALAGLPELGAELRAAADKTSAAMRKALGKFAQKYESARLHRDQALLSDVERIKVLLHPRDQPQERFYGLPYFAARFGERAFIERVLQAIEPFDPTPRELRP